eukprot:gene17403-19987_t
MDTWFAYTSHLTICFPIKGFVVRLHAGNVQFLHHLQSLTIEKSDYYLQKVNGLVNIPRVRIIDYEVPSLVVYLQDFRNQQDA